MTDKNILRLENVLVGFSSLREKNTRFEADLDKAHYELEIYVDPTNTDLINTIKNNVNDLNTENIDGFNSGLTSEAESNGKFPKKLHGQGLIRIKTKSKFQPKIFDATGEPVATVPPLPIGSVVNVLLSTKAYKMGNNKGVTYYIQAVQIVELNTETDAETPKSTISFEAVDGSYVNGSATDIKL